MSAKSSTITTKFPVVFFLEEGTVAGWYFRDADDVTLYGPFAGKDEAVAFGLKVLADGRNQTARTAPTRHAA